MIPSTAEGALLDKAKDRPVALIRDLAAGPVLVLAPHPDDETFGCGMAIAAAVVKNIPVHIVVVTAGEASHPNSIAYPDARLKACRYLEFQNAVDELGAGGITFKVLNYPDGGLGPDHVAELVDQIVSIGAERKTEAIWATWDGDPHCDHQAVASAARNAADRLGTPLWNYAVWGRFGQRAVPSPGRIYRFGDPAARDCKRTAARHYRTQITHMIDDDPGGFRMPAILLDHFLDHDEIFIQHLDQR